METRKMHPMQTNPVLRRKSPVPNLPTMATVPEKAAEKRAPSLMGILASKRIARQFANKVAARRALGFFGSQGAIRLNKEREPTYRMEPRYKFDSKRVEAILKELMDDRLNGFTYSGKRGTMMSKILTEEIKDKIKNLRFDRYKIVCVVTMGEKKDQDLRISSRCAWDTSLDTSASYTWQSGSLFCSATVFGIYHE